MPIAGSHTDIHPLAAELLDGYRKQGSFAPEPVRRLCRMATSSHHEEARAGSRAIFKDIVELLADSFQPALCEAYVDFFSRVVHYCAGLPGQGPLHELLVRHQVDEPGALMARARAAAPVRIEDLDRMLRVLVLSRVTLGADIAVTSVVLQRLKSACPAARILLLGSEKSAALFASDPRVEPVEVNYPRNGLLLDRLAAWRSLAEQVRTLTAGLAPCSVLVVDPDSRLTQLGLLPVAPFGVGYCWFPSRSYAHGSTDSLGGLTNQWLDEVLGPAAQPTLPYVALSHADLERGLRTCSAIPRPVAVVNVGVGGNHAKRIADPFEEALLNALVGVGYSVVLDRGAGQEEFSRTGRLLASLGAPGTKEDSLISQRRSSLRGWQGTLHGLGGLIAASDLYVGYDSAAGHLAAAVGIPSISVFTSQVPERTIHRWRPWGRGDAKVVVARPAERPEGLVRRVMELVS